MTTQLLRRQVTNLATLLIVLVSASGLSGARMSLNTEAPFIASALNPTSTSAGHVQEQPTLLRQFAGL